MTATLTSRWLWDTASVTGARFFRAPVLRQLEHYGVVFGLIVRCAILELDGGS